MVGIRVGGSARGAKRKTSVSKYSLSHYYCRGVTTPLSSSRSYCQRVTTPLSSNRSYGMKYEIDDTPRRKQGAGGFWFPFELQPMSWTSWFLRLDGDTYFFLSPF